MEQRFPCKQCGATLIYKVGTDHLICDYCGFENPIPLSDQTIEEKEYQRSLENLTRESLTEEQITCRCQNCAAEFTLNVNEHAGNCPFCGTAVVSDTSANRYIKPWAILPFLVKRDEATQQFKKWLKSLWFAPGKLKNYARTQGRLVGMYLPYWTYDSQTITNYQGMRGIIYYEPIQYTAVVDGKAVVKTRMVAKTRWRHVSGEVRRFFDDVLIPASRSIPEKIRYRLTSWDLGQLKSYRKEYLSGFRSEIYQTNLKDGFHEARLFMDRIVQNDIRQNIGGDRQRIFNYHTDHRNITYKHILLPAWIAAFRFNGKTYRFIVNGQTGEVQGERPYSPWKIVSTAGLLIIIILLLLVLTQEHVDWNQVIHDFFMMY